MAKELPYFKFEPSEWIAKDIQDCSLSAQGAFINICSYYWIRLGNLPYATALRRHCENNANLMQELCDIDAIKIIDDKIVISFLDNQLDELAEISKVNSENARKGWEKRRKNAIASKSQSESKANRREEKRREDKRKEEKFNTFWNLYQKKTNNKKAKDKFLKLDIETIDKILKVVPKYVSSTPDKQYRKDPLTWLNGECWNDEITETKKATFNPKDYLE